MQNCLGIYIENNLIKYAKVSKYQNSFKVEASGIKFFENLNETIKKIIEETYSFNIPISINLANEKYLYFDIFALLSKNDIQKTVQTEFGAYCDENKFNQNAFETRYALVPNVENKEKIKAIQVIANKIELNKQKQPLEKFRLTKILPIGTAIASIAKLEKKENVLIVNMEEKTTITSVIDRQIYNIETLDMGSQEVLEKINKVENSMTKAYEICKGTTIYTSTELENTQEQPYLQYIIPTLYNIAQEIQKTIENSSVKISNVYLTGSLSVINNADLYFQEFFPSVDCKILRPAIIEEGITQINLKEYIEVNSAIALAIQGLGEGVQALNFKKVNILDQIKGMFAIDLSPNKKKKGEQKEKKKVNISFAGKLEKTEVYLVRAIVAIILMNIIFVIFTKMLMSQMDNKKSEIEELISSENAQISKINKDINSLNSKTTKYNSLIQQLSAINNKISDIAARKNTIPNLLNQIMFVIPEAVQLTAIKNDTDRHIVIEAKSENYDQLGYFIAKLKVGEVLNNVISSSGEKNDKIVTVTIEGELP